VKLIEPGSTHLSTYAGPHLASLLFNRHAIIGEVVSNVLLPPDDALSPEQQDRLESLGWTQPDDMFHPFFHRTWSTETASETIVRDLLTALICVAELEEGEQVACSGGTWCGAPGSGYACDGRGQYGESPHGSGNWGLSAAEARNHQYTTRTRDV
jgi:hypothetical protein